MNCKSPIPLFYLFAILFIIQLFLVNKIQKENVKYNKLRGNSFNSDVSEKVPLSVSLIVPTPSKLLTYINYHVVLWNDHIVVPMAVTKEEQAIVERYIAIAMFPKRLLFKLFEVETPSFPLNLLRNYGASTCVTSHMIFCRSYQIPSFYLYDSILSIPQKLLDKPRKAFLIPEFSMPYSTVPCDFWYECDTKALFLSSISKSQLKSCSKWGPCVSESSSNDNSFLSDDWYSLAPGNYSSSLYCWNDHQFGIVMVKKSTILPEFNERIVIETPHSAEWLMEMHYSGYEFEVLSHGWFINLASSLNQENEDMSISKLKHMPGISPKLVDMIRFVIPKKYKGVKYLPICPRK